MRNDVKKKLVNYIYVFLILLTNFWLINLDIRNILIFITLFIINCITKLFVLRELKIKYLIINNIKNHLCVVNLGIILYLLEINIFNIISLNYVLKYYGIV